MSEEPEPTTIPNVFVTTCPFPPGGVIVPTPPPGKIAVVLKIVFHNNKLSTYYRLDDAPDKTD